MSLSGKTSLVTGSSRGIGRAIARRFADAGGRVAVHYNRSEHLAREVFSSLPGSGHLLLHADIADPAAAEKLINDALEGFGQLDVLVNNAGVFEHHPALTTDYAAWQAAWESTLRTNLLAAANLSYHAARHMASFGHGRIINISSRGAFRGEPDAPAYGASKAGMNSMGQSMAKALAPRNILVFTLAPGWVETDMATEYLQGPDGDAVRAQSPFNRIATPDEMADIALFLATDAPAYMTGAIIDANGASYLRT